MDIKNIIEPWNEFYARTRTQIVWPEFEKEHDSFLHAVGSISHYSNFLEDIFFIFLIFSKIPDGVARYLGFKMNNNDKSEIMKILAEEFETKDPDVFERARVFFRYAQICTANRNFIIHGSKKGYTNGKFKLQKQSRGNVGKYSTIEIELTDLRQMSQDMSNVAQFGSRLQAVMSQFPDRLATTEEGQIFHVPLLDAPPEPLKWENYKIDEA